MSSTKRDRESTDTPSGGKKSKSTTIAKFYGSAGSFTQVAAEKYFQIHHESVDLSGSSSLSDLFNSVSNGTADNVIVPYENSISGVISSTIVHLLTHPTLHIVGEILDADELCLCAPANATLSSIRTVLSHSAILLQAHTFVDSLASKNGGTAVKGQPTFDSASACAEVGNDVTKAAIASRRAAEIHGLTVLETNFADVESETRYVILATTPAESSNRLGRHCSVSYVLPNRPGAMFKSLSCFAFRDLSIIKVSTVPLGGKKELLVGGGATGASGSDLVRSSSSSGSLSRWDYAFVVDFVASANPEVNQAALNSLKEFAKSVRILGEYSPAEMKAESPSKSMMHLAAF